MRFRTTHTLIVTFFIALHAPAAFAQGMFITNERDVGIGTEIPLGPLHVLRSNTTEEFLFLESQEGGGADDKAMMQLINNGGMRIEFNDVAQGTVWRVQAATGSQDRFEVTKMGTGDIELSLDASGNLQVLGTVTEMSDREAKQDFGAVQGETVLERLSAVPVSEWSYKRNPDTRHIGPMAQDFHAAFGLGEDDRHISARDMAGVNLAAIQALVNRNQELESRVAELESLEQEISTLRTMINQLSN